MAARRPRRFSWTVVLPSPRCRPGRDLGPQAPGRPSLALVAVVLIGAVLAAVHHAEVVAHRVGEPLGSLVLAVAVTVIEVALIVTLMVTGGRTPRRWPATRCSPR